VGLRAATRFLRCAGGRVHFAGRCVAWCRGARDSSGRGGTAALLKAAVASGAVIAGATDAQVAACEEYALKIGLAFQVADDILDVEASSEELGKTAGKDEAVDKTTYPKLLGLDRSKEVAAELVAEAKAALAEFGEAAAPLNGLADYIINRKN